MMYTISRIRLKRHGVYTKERSVIRDNTTSTLPWVLLTVLLGAGVVATGYSRTRSAEPIVHHSIHDAAAMGDVAAVQAMIDDGTDPNMIDSCGNTALMMAAASGKPETVQLLLSLGADPNRVSHSGATSLFFAAGAPKGSMESVRYLLRGGADVNQTVRRRTPLMVAALNGGFQAMAVLLDAGADPEARDESGQTALWYAAAGSGDGSELRLLLALGADATEVDKHGRSPLHEAALQGAARLTSLLIAAGANPTRPDRNGVSALDLAHECPDKAVLASLGADVRHTLPAAGTARRNKDVQHALSSIADE